jgi:hypothetical protein
MRERASGSSSPRSRSSPNAASRAPAPARSPIAPANLHSLALGAAGLAYSQAPECLYVTGVDPTGAEFAEAHADALVRLLLPVQR